MKGPGHRLYTVCAQAAHRFGGWAAVCSVAACVTAPPDFEGIPLRNPTAQIGAIVRFDLSQFAGHWTVWQRGDDAWPLFTFSVAGTGWTEANAAGIRSGALEVTDPGRMILTYEDGAQRDLWVVWVDEGHDTVALGTPDGSFGVIAQRRGVLRSDQQTAAAQVLDFNGYRTRDWLVLIGPDEG